ncbi:hypothetical protein [Terasakiella pusilla]|uniref:hypothetical protein n=1 Tax=Terasakiella pusilla TaxID=64973 RepID=UPI003AA9C010
MFNIPELRSTKTLFVINKDFYQTKTGEIRCSIQVLAPANDPRRPNKKGYSVMEYASEPAVYDALNLDNGPCMVEFQSEPREAKNAYGGMTNQDYLVSVVSLPGQRPAAEQKSAQAK